MAETVALELTGVDRIAGGAEVAETGTVVAPGGNLAVRGFAFA